ncbi:MAG: HD-GYP domain-containing protein [Candidatus Latescibacterota bacterium]
MSERDFFPIHLHMILVDSIRSFDIYIRIKNRMVLYHSGGDRFTAGVRDQLISNGIQALYIHKTDRGAYDRYIEDNLESVLSNPALDQRERAEIAHRSISNIAQTLFENPRSQTIVRYKAAIGATMDFVMHEEGAVGTLIRLTSHDFVTYIHSVNVGIFAIGLAKALLQDDPAHDMRELASGFFLHDIGKCAIPLEVLNKPGPLTDDEWKIMRRHPFEGYKLLDQFGALTEEAKYIVMEHHERHDGTGYPHGMKGYQINMYSKICCIADVFDALTSVRPYKESKTPFHALTIMKNQMHREFDPDFFARFVMMFAEQKQSSAAQSPKRQ